MSIRETLNEKPILAYAVAGVGVLCAVILLLTQLVGEGPVEPPESDFFSSDDGASFFAADLANVPPFDHGGKTAVRAAVFECDGDRFVGYLERYTPEMHKSVVAMNGDPLGAEMSQWAANGGMEVKRPGDETWTNTANSAAYISIVEVMCPDGKKRAEPVFP